MKSWERIFLVWLACPALEDISQQVKLLFLIADKRLSRMRIVLLHVGQIARPVGHIRQTAGFSLANTIAARSSYARLQTTPQRRQYFRRLSTNGPGQREPASGSSTAEGGASFLSSPMGWWRHNSSKLKSMMQSFGYLTIATYLGIYVVTLGSMYACVRVGMVQGPDVNGFINGWFVKRALLGDKDVHIPVEYTEFATAWVLTKTTEPVRLVATIAAVPVVVRRSPEALLRLLRVPAEAIAARGVPGSSSGSGGDVAKKAGALFFAACGVPVSDGRTSWRPQSRQQH